MSRPGKPPDARERTAPRAQQDGEILGGGTLTSAGFIPHLRYRGLRCPVRVMILNTSRGNVVATNWLQRPLPQRRGHCYLFALPGGGSIEGPIS